MTITMRVVCAIALVILGVYILFQASGSHIAVATGVGFVIAGVGLVVP